MAKKKSKDIALPDEARAADLLPPDQEEWAPPYKKVAERRVVGWLLSQRLCLRRARRPAGNSRKFWKRVEDDDPFLPSTGRRIAQAGEVTRITKITDGGFYPVDRAERNPAPKVEKAPPPPKKRVPKKVVKTPEQERDERRAKYVPPPKKRRQPERDPFYDDPSPRRTSRRVPKKEPIHTRDRKVVPPPEPVRRRAPEPEPEPEPTPPAIERTPPAAGSPIDRRPPRFVQKKKKKSGRLRVGRVATRAATPQERPGLMRSQFMRDGKTSAQIRAEKEQAQIEAEEEIMPPPLRSTQNTLDLLAQLQAAAAAHDDGHLGDLSYMISGAANEGRKRAPRRAKKVVPRKTAPKPTPEPAPAPKPPPVEPPLDRRPPRPKSETERAPAAPPTKQDDGMEGLFGSSSDTRVRIGKRVKPKPKPEED